MTLDLTPTSARTIRYFRCRKRRDGASVECDERYFEEEIYLEAAGKLLGRVELKPEHVAAVTAQIEEDARQQATGAEARANETRSRLAEVRAQKKRLLLRELESGEVDDTCREVKAELDREEALLSERLTRGEAEAGRRQAIILSKAAAILGAGARAFGAVDNAEVKGLLLRTIFTKLELSGGRIRQATLHPLFEYFEKLIRKLQIPLTFHIDCLLLGTPDGEPVEAGTSCQNGPDCTHPTISEELEKDIEQCYAELERRAFFS